MRLLPATLMLAACVFGVLMGPSTVAAEVSAAECVSASSTELDHGLNYTFENRCDAAVRCELQWLLTCTKGNAVRRFPGHAGFGLAVAESHEEMASKDACGTDDWSVDNVNWRCNSR